MCMYTVVQHQRDWQGGHIYSVRTHIKYMYVYRSLARRDWEGGRIYSVRTHIIYMCMYTVVQRQRDWQGGRRCHRRA